MFSKQAFLFALNYSAGGKKIKSFFKDKLFTLRNLWYITCLIFTVLFIKASFTTIGKHMGEKQLYECEVLQGYVQPPGYKESSSTFVLVLRDQYKRLFDLEVTPSAYYQCMTTKHATFKLYDSVITKKHESPVDMLMALGSFLAVIIMAVWTINRFVL